MCTSVNTTVCVLSHVQLCVMLWTIACQVPLSMGFLRQEYWSGLSFPPLGDLPDPGIELVSPALQDKAGDGTRIWAEESQPRRRPQSSADAPQTGVRLSLPHPTVPFSTSSFPPSSSSLLFDSYIITNSIVCALICSQKP